MHKIACIGEVMIELVTQGATGAQVGVAGDSYNTAVYLARALGPAARVSYVTALGTDSFSGRILAHMAHHGIAADHVERRADKMPGLYAIETDDTGERSFAYWRSDSAARTLFAEPCTVGLDRLKEFDLVLLTGISMAILPAEMRQSLLRALDDYRAGGGRLAYDSNHRPRLWEDADTAREVNAACWRRADIALPSVDDEMAIFGDRSEAEAVARLRGYGCRDGALKRGAKGPLALDPDVPEQTFAPAAKVVDTTAAGDSFNAGYLAARLAGQSVSDAMRAAHDLASHVIGHRGAIVPT